MKCERPTVLGANCGTCEACRGRWAARERVLGDPMGRTTIGPNPAETIAEAKAERARLSSEEMDEIEPTVEEKLRHAEENVDKYYVKATAPLPPVIPCCGSDSCWAHYEQDERGPCWGQVQAIDEDQWGDEWEWIHGCEGHPERWGAYVPPPKE